MVVTPPSCWILEVLIAGEMTYLMSGVMSAYGIFLAIFLS
jgi:hypothetical protein